MYIYTYNVKWNKWYKESKSACFGLLFRLGGQRISL